jgi:hypothetical protein
MRRIADLHPGEGKTDARDAYVIADAARTMPHTLRRVGAEEETLAGLSVLAGYDDDPAAQCTRLSNRLRDFLLHVHPALERLLGKHIDRAVCSTSSPPHPPQPHYGTWNGWNHRSAAHPLAAPSQDATHHNPRRSGHANRPRARHHRVRPSHRRSGNPATRRACRTGRVGRRPGSSAGGPHLSPRS